MVTSKQQHILRVTELLEKGTETRDVIREMAAVSGRSVRAIEGYITEAKRVLNERNKQKELIRQSQVSVTLKEAINETIISDLELEAILCQIAKGNVGIEEWVKGESVLRGVTPLEVTSAIRTLFTKRGSNAPTKIAQTDTRGNDILILPAKDI
jgi:hypothetical protein